MPTQCEELQADSSGMTAKAVCQAMSGAAGV